jgi:hypothetical protein
VSDQALAQPQANTTPSALLPMKTSPILRCVFRSEVGLSHIPSIGQADLGTNRLWYVGKGCLPVVNFDTLDQIRSAVPSTPDVNHAWAIHGQLVIGAGGSMIGGVLPPMMGQILI